MQKWFLASKTIWVNGLVLGGLVAASQEGMLGDAGELLNENPELVAAAVPSLGNILTRFSTHTPTGPGGKSGFKSKTMWWNALTIAGGAIAVALEFQTAGFALIGLALVNMVLRGVTGSSVTLLPHRRAY